MKAFYLEVCHWNMTQRCHNPKHPDYQYYGAKGIAVCKRWRGRYGCLIFIRDILRSLGPRPEGTNPRTGLSSFHLDRISNEKGYSIDNLRWSHASVSYLNRRKGKRGKNKTTR